MRLFVCCFSAFAFACPFRLPLTAFVFSSFISGGKGEASSLIIHWLFFIGGAGVGRRDIQTEELILTTWEHDDDTGTRRRRRAAEGA